jgi:hypothetical protein
MLGVRSEYSVNERPSPAAEPEGNGSTFADLFVCDLGEVLCAVE